MLGDVAVAVHPEDERYRHLVGKRVKLPLTDRTIPIIADEYVDKTFGTGCVKITPAHDLNDYAIGQRHGLPQICVLTLDAKISDAAPAAYRGLDRFDARKQVLKDLDAQGLLVSEKKHKLNVPRSDRTGVIVEPMLTDQWFVKMDGLAARGLARGRKRRRQVLLRNTGRATYNHWLKNIQDWCISRQLWWGHQIPAWYDDEGTIYVARNEAEAKAKGRWQGTLRRDPDVLDTWFSSAPDSVHHAGLAGRYTRPESLPALIGTGDRQRHHFLLGRTDDHDDAAFHRQGSVPTRVYQRDGARCRRPEDVQVQGQHARSAGPDRRHQLRCAAREIDARA